MAIRAECISKRYFRASGASNHFFAVQEADFALPGGSLSVLVGRSGSGKTTLLNMLAGLLTPTNGRVLLGDADLYSLNDDELSAVRCQRIGVIPQGRAAIDTLTVMENILLPNMLRKAGLSDVQKRAEQLLDRLGIGHLTGVMPAELSGGELRRMAVVRALAHRPDVILADEPTADLDDENSKLVLDLLRDAANGGAAVLLSTHELDALRYADATFKLDDGKLIQGNG